MTGDLRLDGGELPSTAGVPVPKRAVLSAGRPAARALLHAWFDLEVYGGRHVPRSGPVVLAGNHVGWLDGPLLAICTPRPVHVLTKIEMFEGAMGRLLTASGQIPLNRFEVDLNAIRLALRTLRDGLAVGVFPEGTRGAGDLAQTRAGAAYLALVTGAPVVPVSFLGTRLPGGHSSSIPPRGSRMAISFGRPVLVDSRPWPRTREQVQEAAAQVKAAIIDTMRQAEERTGMRLPGPLGPEPVRR